MDNKYISMGEKKCTKDVELKIYLLLLLYMSGSPAMATTRIRGAAATYFLLNVFLNISKFIGLHQVIVIY